jgi:hypothetical protein
MRASSPGEPAVELQAPTEKRTLKFWLAFLATLVLLCTASVYSPKQDHLGAISLDGDPSWYRNYEVGFEIQDNDILFHGIGQSIRNAQEADIIFLGTSRPLFALDWRMFEDFEREHHLKMFNMAFAGTPSGEFSLQVIKKWHLKPKLWVVDYYAGSGEARGLPNNSFFHKHLISAFHDSGVDRVLSYGGARAFRNVLGRDLRWRIKKIAGLLNDFPYRSAKTGNWDVDNWPNYQSKNNSPMKLTDDQLCPAPSEELEEAKRYVEEIGGIVVLTQVPSRYSCIQQVRDIAAALAVPLFTINAEQFSSVDGGGHTDAVSAHRYTKAFFDWLVQLPQFQQLFPGNANAR